MATTPVSRAFARRWAIIAAGVLVSAVLAVAVLFVVTPTYKAQARVLLLPPVTAQDENPYLSLDGNTGFADVVSQRMIDAKTIAAIQAEGSNAQYTVTRDLTTSAPILLVVGQGKTAAEALTTLHDVTAMVAPTLTTLQESANVPTKALVTLSTVSSDVKATPIRKSQLRAAIGLGAVGVALTFLLVGLLDRLQRRRQPVAEVAPVTSARPKSVPAGSGERRGNERRGNDRSTSERRGSERGGSERSSNERSSNDRSRNQAKRGQPRRETSGGRDEGLGLLGEDPNRDRPATQLLASGESEPAGNHGR